MISVQTQRSQGQPNAESPLAANKHTHSQKNLPSQTACHFTATVQIKSPLSALLDLECRLHAPLSILLTRHQVTPRNYGMAAFALLVSCPALEEVTWAEAPISVSMSDFSSTACYCVAVAHVLWRSGPTKKQSQYPFYFRPNPTAMSALVGQHLRTQAGR